MKQVSLICIFCLSYLGLFAQNGNVGVGTTSPQAKLHVNGDLLLEDNLEVKNSTDATIFRMNPNSGKFEILDTNGDVVYSIGLDTSSSSAAQKKVSLSSAISSGNQPRVDIIILPNGNTKEVFRRTDGTIELTREYGGIVLETLFYPDGITERQKDVYFPFIGNVASQKFAPNGALTSETSFSTDGSIIERTYHPDGTTSKSTTTYDGGSSDKVTKEKFDSNGNLLLKEVFENGENKFFNKDNVEIVKEEFENEYIKTISKPALGNYNMTYADGSTIGDMDSGDKTDITSANVKIEKGDNTLNLTDVGFDVLDSETNLQFFVDHFGISKFEGGNFVGLDFNAIGEGVDVFGDMDIGGLLSKLGGSFKIDHPQDPKNKFLYHSFVESPDMMNVYNGNITTNNKGDAVVVLPEYFEALNKDFRYQLSVIGSFAQAAIWKKIENNKFVIKTDEPNIEVSWQITGIRNDEFAKNNRIQVEVEKTGYDKGKLIYDPNRVGPYSANMKKHWDQSKEKE